MQAGQRQIGETPHQHIINKRSPRATTKYGTQPRVLICEDDPMTLLQLKYTFAALGCNVTSVALGSAAFHRLEGEEFDLVLMDFSMPFMNADQTMGDLLPWRRISTPFVLMSSSDHRAEAQGLGFLAFYPKPITVSVADEILRRFVVPFGTSLSISDSAELEILEPGESHVEQMA